MADKVGEAFVELHYRVDGLQRDMATARRRIDADVTQLNQGVQSRTRTMFAGVETQLNRVSNGISLLRNLVVVSFAGQMLSSVANFAGQIAEAGNQTAILRARLDTMLGAGTFQEVQRSADRLGVSIRAAADSTARFGLAAQDIGLTRDETIKLTETVVRLGRIGGSSATEVENGMYQLSQSLASGRFQGDELRSVMESMPEVIRVIARDLGVSTGELRKMGSEGRLTAEIVAGALLRAADETAKRFEDLPSSLEQSQARWANAATRLFAALDEKLGASRFVQWFNEFRTAGAQQVMSWLGTATPQDELEAKEFQLKELLAASENASLGGPHAVDRGGPVPGLGTEQAQRLIREIAELKAKASREAASATGDVATQPASSGIGGPKIAKAWELYPTAEGEEAIESYQKFITPILQSIEKDQKKITSTGTSEAEKLKSRLESLRSQSMSQMERYQQRLAEVDELVKKGVATEKEGAAIKAQIQRQMAQTGDAEAKRLRSRLETLDSQSMSQLERYKGQLEEVDALVRRGIATEQEGARIKKQIEAEIAELQKRRTAAEKEIQEREEERMRLNEEAAQKRRDFTLETLREQEERWKARDPAGYFRATGDIDLAPIYDAKAGAEEAFADLADSAQRYGEMMGNGIRAGADLVADSLTQMALTGKFAIDDLLKSLAELAVSMAIRQGVNAAFGAMGYGLFGPPGAQAGAGAQPTPVAGMPIGGHARGGVFHAGMVLPLARGGVVDAAHLVPLARGAALIGEAGPEAVMPLTRDGQGRLGVRSSGEGGGGKIIINDQRGRGAPPIEATQAPGQGGNPDWTLLIRAEVNRTIGGGHADRSLRERFNMQPSTVR